MDNKNNCIAFIGQSTNQSTLSEYLKLLNNISTNTHIDKLINCSDIKLKDDFIEQTNEQIEIISKIYKLNQLENKKHNLLNQKRKKYSYMLNYTLKNK